MMPFRHHSLLSCYVSPPEENAHARVSEVIPIRNDDFHNGEGDLRFSFHGNLTM